MGANVANTTSGHNQDFVGTYRRFGKTGPVYEVVEVEDDETVRICLVESGREERYPAAEVRKDLLA
jgi:hypothetical protein